LQKRQVRRILVRTTLFIIAIALQQVSCCRDAHSQSLQQTYANDAVQNSLQQCKERAQSVSNRKYSLSPTELELLESIELLLDLHPTQSHRFVLPQKPAQARPAIDQLTKLFGSKDSFDTFQDAINRLSASIESSAIQAEADSKLETAFRLRSHAAGLRSTVSTSARGLPQDAWIHTTGWNILKHVPKVSVNHPKTLWPAGTYSMLTTQNFEIASQTGTKPTEEVAEVCERAYAIWKQLFFPYWSGGKLSPPRYIPTTNKRFSVAVYRDKTAYTNALKTIERNVGISTGYYEPNRNISLFYWDGAKTSPTIIHELVHQFFFESSAQEVVLNTDTNPGFWVVEGIALYLESMSTRTVGGGTMVEVGGWDASRFQAARYRRLHDEYWIDWDDFRSASGAEFRRNPEINKWYSHASGLAQLWMDNTDEHRRGFVDYIASVYVGKANAELLREWNNDTKLRESYDKFLMAGPISRLPRPYFANRKEAVLSRCEATAEQLLNWPKAYRTMTWLDLSFNPVDDSLFLEGDTERDPAWNVVRLNLESTRVTDRSLPSIGKMKDLVELDLSNCNVTDQGLASLNGHKMLKTLWLNACPITDNSIAILNSLPQLEQLHVKGSAISQQTWANFLGQRPRLKSSSSGP
ncbi:MAG: hypothetical protein ABL921_28250, partial [Pirellula sp.]